MRRRWLFWRVAAVLTGLWRLFPLRGGGRVLDRLVFERAARFGDGRAPLDGGTVLVRFTNPSEAALYVWRTYEAEVMAAIDAVLAPGMTAIDVGANCGVLTVAMREAVGPTGRVIAIDPSPEACERVSSQVRVNGYTNVQVEELALGDSTRTQEYFPARVGIGALPEEPGELTAEGRLEATVTTFDEVVRRHGLDELGLVKLDTDGAEHEILRGAEETLRRLRPALVLELFPRGLHGRRTDADGLVSLLHGHGYELRAPVFRPSPAASARPARFVGFEPTSDPGVPASPGTVNVLALPRCL